MLVAADDDNEDEESDDNDEEKDDEEKGDKEMRKRKRRRIPNAKTLAVSWPDHPNDSSWPRPGTTWTEKAGREAAEGTGADRLKGRSQLSPILWGGYDSYD